MKINKHNNGNALLIAIIIMGILLTLSLAVSDMLITTLKDNRLLLEKTKAWYAAESGIENALFAVYNHKPGFEEQINHTTNNPPYSYSIQAASDRFPIIANTNSSSDDENQYATLRLNESVAIPLFAENAEVKRFHVDYYLNPRLNTNTRAENIDILRWKIFGIKRGEQLLEVLSEFVPMGMNGSEGDTAENPTCLGIDDNCYNAGSFYERQGDDTFIVHKADFLTNSGKLISDFLNQHDQNFLVLTNMVNTNIIGLPGQNEQTRRRIANIRYRVIAEDENDAKFTLPTIKITSDGFAGTTTNATKQSINLEIKREAFLPVFGYALYRTGP